MRPSSLKTWRARLASRVELTTDGHKPYLEAIEGTFGSDIDFAMLIKLFGQSDPESQRRYSSARYIGAEKRRITGQTDSAHVSTSYVERQNLTMRMGMRRFTRLTNAFSKKLENNMHAIALYFMHYNYARPHTTLSEQYPTTPAISAGITDHVGTALEIVALLDERPNSN
jgi:hypothetical protein